MAQQIYLTDGEEKEVLDALECKMMIEYDKGNTENGDALQNVLDKMT